MDKIYYKTLQETLYHEKLVNGLNVYLLPKIGFSKTFGLCTTKYGSIDVSFFNRQGEEVNTVDGIAHFLEHKMFDYQDTDVSDLFARLGATTNAYTSSTRTAYLFSTTENEADCVELLLDFVQEFSISDQSVEKEKGIINQEIKMYDDDPDWQVYFGSIANLYHNHPVARDIAGTCDDVNSITRKQLEACYNVFYHPGNMMLFVVGNINPEALMERIRDNQKQKSFIEEPVIKRIAVKEPLSVKYQYREKIMDVALNKTIVSFKVNEISTDCDFNLKRSLSFNLLFDLLFSKSSSLYNDWLEKGLINDSFSYNYTQERDYAFLQIGCDIEDYQKFIDNLTGFVDNISDLKIKDEDFERIKKKNIGNLINMYNSPEAIANMFSSYYFEGVISLDIIDVINQLTIVDLQNILKYFNKDLMTAYVVRHE